MKQLLSQAWSTLEDTANYAKNQVSESARTKADNVLGKYIHKNIAVLFFWDDDVQEMVDKICDLVNDGNRQQALTESERLKSHITLKLNRDRKYGQRFKEKFEEWTPDTETIKRRAEQMDDNAFLEWVGDKLKDELPDDVEDEIDGK